MTDVVLLALALVAPGRAQPEPEEREPEQVILPWEVPADPCPPSSGGPCPEGSPRGPVVLDRIVAVVGDRLVMDSDLRLEADLAVRDPSPLGVLQRRRTDRLDFLVDLAVVRGLAGEIAVYQPDADEVQARLERLRATFPEVTDYRAFQDEHGLDDDSLAGVLYSRLVVERYVSRNVVFAAEAAHDTPPELDARYAAWIASQRGTVQIRIVPAVNGDEG